MSDALGVGGPAASLVWTNDFPQSSSRREWLEPGIPVGFGLVFFASTLFGGSISLFATKALFGLAFILLGVPWALRLIEHRRPNSIQIDSERRSIVRTRVVHESLATLGLVVLTFGVASFVLWYWDPFSFLPIQTEISRARQAMTIYWAIGLGAAATFIFAFRPWRRRLVFSPDGLAYRRFGPTVFIPWDAIDTITPHSNGLMQTAIITARPPAQLPALERKRLPDGSTRAKLAVYGMTVDPATIVYLIRRFAADPDARQLLATAEHPEHLFTGPSWQERIAMEPGQAWRPLSPETSV